MPSLEALFSSGRIIDLILALMAVEALALFVIQIKSGRGLAKVAVATNLAAGAALMLALRTALTGSPWTFTAGFLIAALFLHVADLWARWD